jgi:hypothetical protein
MKNVDVPILYVPIIKPLSPLSHWLHRRGGPSQRDIPRASEERHKGIRGSARKHSRLRSSERVLGGFVWISWLVGGFKHALFSIIYGMSSFPLTFIFFKMVKATNQMDMEVS